MACYRSTRNCHYIETLDSAFKKKSSNRGAVLNFSTIGKCIVCDNVNEWAMVRVRLIKF